MRCNGWYSQPMVEYCLTNNLITHENIKYVLESSLNVPMNYFNDLRSGGVLT